MDRQSAPNDIIASPSAIASVLTRLSDNEAVPHHGVREPAPNEKLGNTERSLHLDPIPDLHTLDPHEARAIEMEVLSYPKKAAWIRGCSNPASPFPQRTCKQRSCPSCAARVWRRYAERAAALIREMQNPVLVMITLRSSGITDLRSTITEFRGGLAALKRRTCFANVRAGVGAIETKLLRDRKGWLVHAHPVLDADAIDVAAVTTAWGDLIGHRGTFRLHKKPRIHASRAMRVASYITKSSTWCPEPGEMEPQYLAVLIPAIRGKRLWIEWGTKGVQE
jgi:hypothetical protein